MWGGCNLFAEMSLIQSYSLIRHPGLCLGHRSFGVTLLGVHPSPFPLGGLPLWALPPSGWFCLDVLLSLNPASSALSFTPLVTPPAPERCLSRRGKIFLYIFSPKTLSLWVLVKQMWEIFKGRVNVLLCHLFSLQTTPCLKERKGKRNWKRSRKNPNKQNLKISK